MCYLEAVFPPFLVLLTDSGNHPSSQFSFQDIDEANKVCLSCDELGGFAPSSERSKKGRLLSALEESTGCRVLIPAAC